MEAEIAKAQQVGFRAAWNAISKKGTLIEHIEILDFIIDRMKQHTQSVREAHRGDPDDPAFYYTTPFPVMKERGAVRALSAICLEFQHAHPFAQELLQHLDEELRHCLTKGRVKMTTPEDVDKLLSSLHGRVRPVDRLCLPHEEQIENLLFRSVSKPSGEKAIVVGTSMEIEIWQRQQGFAVTDDTFPSHKHYGFDLRWIDKLKEMQAARYPPLWWIRPHLNEDVEHGALFGLFEPIRAMTADGVIPEDCAIYLACESPRESSLEPWRKLYDTESLTESNCIDNADGTAVTCKCLSGGYEEFMETVVFEKLPQYQFLLTRLRAKLLARLDLATSMQQKIMAYSASAAFAAFSILGNVLVAKPEAGGA